MNLQPELPELDLLSQKLVYFVGIKGVGMTALAILLDDAGVEVMGADVAESFVTDPLLQSRGIEVQDFVGARFPEETSVVVYSGAHKGSQQRLVQQAKELGLPCLNLAQATGLVSQQKETIAVCGVGGKSTTSALLSWILEKAGMQPSFAVGVGTIPNLGSSARWQPEGKHFVVEADEYVADPQLAPAELTPRFLALSPAHIICTSLTFDHPDVYKNFVDTQAAFRALFSKLPTGGVMVLNGDIPELRELANEFSETHQVIFVGEQEENQVRVRNLRVENGLGLAELETPEETFSLTLPIPGFHNLKNAAYATVMALSLGVSVNDIQAAVQEFRSTTRRFEFLGTTSRGLNCYDDYAHHPRELVAIAETLQTWFAQDKVAVAFQPHTYSRTKALFSEFVEALLQMPGEFLLLPIFSSAREQEDSTISSDLLAAELQKRGKAVRSLQNQAELLEYLQQFEQTGNVFITLGAGDIYTVYEHLTFRTTA